MGILHGTFCGKSNNALSDINFLTLLSIHMSVVPFDANAGYHAPDFSCTFLYTVAPLGILQFGIQIAIVSCQQ